MKDEEKTVCPICDAIIDEKATSCHRCGAVFAENEYVCGNCGTPLRVGEKVCRKCGMDFGVKEYACPLCGAPVSADAIVCSKCGAEFSENVYRCSFCGEKIRRDVKSCPHCSATLVEEIKIEEKVGEVSEEEEKKPGVMGKLRTRRLLFPFTAIIGQEMMKRAELLNAINPNIGGALLRGHRGTAKSVSVRALAEILPPIEVVSGCRFSCDPKDTRTLCWECREKLKDGPLPTEIRRVRVIDLPLNATEDRVVGSIDIDKILAEGLKAFEPGILADANRGVLYIDEINLLDDFLVDVLLDAAAMGVVTVERESVSVSYPAKFIIVGSMNPEEGGLRPQLLDRIALVVEITGIADIDVRKKIVAMREEATKDIISFRKKHEPATKRLRARIIRARELLPRVSIPDRFLDAIGKTSVEFQLDGHRPDIMMERTARTNAAFEGRNTVTFEDLMVAGEMVIPHRMKKGVFEAEDFSRERLEAVFRASLGEET
ncbi:MAG: ATP-binding protein [Candidatus Omnitrophica bacterium]|nr:ATP-binding protein [Candidatus Omnitrophota bacterium]